MTVSQFSGLPFGDEDVTRLVASSLPCALKYGSLPPELLLVAGFGSVFAPHALAVGLRIWTVRQAKRDKDALAARTGTASTPAGPKPPRTTPENGAAQVAGSGS